MAIDPVAWPGLGRRDVVKDVARIHQRAGCHFLLEAVLEFILIGKTVLREPVLGKAGEPGQGDAADLALLAKVKTHRCRWQVNGAAIAVLEVPNAASQLPLLRNIEPRPVAVAVAGGEGDGGLLQQLDGAADAGLVVTNKLGEVWVHGDGRRGQGGRRFQSLRYDTSGEAAGCAKGP